MLADLEKGNLRLGIGGGKTKIEGQGVVMGGAEPESRPSQRGVHREQSRVSINERGENSGPTTCKPVWENIPSPILKKSLKKNGLIGVKFGKKALEKGITKEKIQRGS